MGSSAEDDRNQLGSGGDVGLRQDSRDVDLDGLLGTPQLGGDG
jgi:hypothetical protein